MGTVHYYRRSEESRQAIKEGLEEYERRQFQQDYEHMQAACRPPLTEVERRRVEKSTIDKAMPWIMVVGLLLVIVVCGALINMAVNWSAGLPLMFNEW